MMINEARQEPWTAVPNVYYDRIKPTLTDSQRAVADTVIRYTYGYHRQSAAISNAQFAKKGNKTVQGIIKAKKQLIEMGLLIVVRPGGGSRTGVYMLDLYYDDPAKSIRAQQLAQQLPQQPTDAQDAAHISSEDTYQSEEQQTKRVDVTEQQTHAQMVVDTVPELDTEASVYDGNRLEEADTTSEHTPTCLYEPAAHLPQISSRWVVNDDESGTSGVLEFTQEPAADTPMDTVDQMPTEQIHNTPISDMESAAETLANTESDEGSTSKLSLPPQDPGICNIYINNKQIAEGEVETKEERKKAHANVCSILRSWGMELESKDYAFIGYCFKNYGIEAVQQKVQIMRFQRKRGVKLLNPLGWLRNALAMDYQYSRWDSEAVKAQEKARRAVENSQQRGQEWKQHVETFNYNSAQAALQKLMDNLN